MKSLTGLFYHPRRAISDAEVITIAQAECAGRGWPWREPIDARLTRDCWVVETNRNNRGANVRIEIDCQSGQVLKAHHMPR